MSTKTRGRGGKKIIPNAISSEMQHKTYALGSDISDLQNLRNDIVLHLPINIEDEDVKVMMNNIRSQTIETQPYENSRIQAPAIEESDNKDTSNQNEDRLQHDSQYIQDNVKNTPLEISTLSDRFVVKRNVLEMMIEFKDSTNELNRNESWLPRTSQACMWCCHSFDNSPISIPIKYERDRFYVSGCYCSFGCAARSLFETNISDTRWEQYSLLNLLYKRMYNLPRLSKVRLAPPRESLKMFGGIFTVDEFRQQTNNPHYEYNIIYPPMIAITPRLEEIVINHQMPVTTASGSKTNLNIPINQAMVDKAKKSLQDRRAEIKTNSLQAFLNLQVRSSESV